MFSIKSKWSLPSIPNPNPELSNWAHFVYFREENIIHFSVAVYFRNIYFYNNLCFYQTIIEWGIFIHKFMILTLKLLQKMLLHLCFT